MTEPSADRLPRMYGEFAHLWPLISPPEDYAEEAAHWRAVMRGHLGPGRHEILELGVGGGNNLSHLTDHFQATAVDISEQMLAHSRRLNPGVAHHLGDMRTVRLGRTFRAVLIHDAIDYLLTEEDVRATLETARCHLEPGGLLVAAPDYTRESFTDGALHQHTNGDETTHFGFVEYVWDPDPADTTAELLMVYLIRQGGQVRVEEDRHTIGLFGTDRWLRWIDEAGFVAGRHPYDVHEDGRESFLFVGVAR